MTKIEGEGKRLSSPPPHFTSISQLNIAKKIIIIIKKAITNMQMVPVAL